MKPKREKILQKYPIRMGFGVINSNASRQEIMVQNQTAGLLADQADAPDTLAIRNCLRDAAGANEASGTIAIAKLRKLIPLLDLPVVRLGTVSTTPLDPAFRLYKPFEVLSEFYRELRSFLESPEAQTEEIARLYLRMAVFAGEYPRLLEAGRDFLDAEASEWMRRRWDTQQSFPQLVFATSYGCQSHCPYCYATDVDRDHPCELTLENFRQALGWAEKQECRIISFAGGEPTFHPLAKLFFEEVRTRGLRTYFNSNLLCEPEVIAGFDGGWVINIGIHAQAARYTPKKDRLHFDRNIDSLRERNVPVFLRYNFERQNEESIADALSLAQTLKVRQVNFAIPMPSLSRRNRHATPEDLLDCGQFLVRATEAFRAEGLTAILSKPVPPCAIPEDKLAFLRAGEALAPACNIPKRGWTQNVLVSPDLTISPCVGVATRGPSLLSFRDFGEISDYLVGHLRSILSPMPFQACANCNFHVDGRCLGGCLAYFTDGSAPAAGPLVTIRLAQPAAGEPK